MYWGKRRNSPRVSPGSRLVGSFTHSFPRQHDTVLGPVEDLKGIRNSCCHRTLADRSNDYVQVAHSDGFGELLVTTAGILSLGGELSGFSQGCLFELNVCLPLKFTR